MQMGEHRGHVQSTQAGLDAEGDATRRYRGMCLCGWSSDTSKDFRDADAALHQHITEYSSTGDEGGQAL